MRKLSVTIATLTILVCLGSPVLEACGAKFLVATRVGRFQKLLFAAHAANILVYRHSSDQKLEEFVVKLTGMLEGVGHTVMVATSEAELRDAARTHQFNIVMMELDVARQLRADVASWSAETAVLPMVTYASTPVAARAEREFGQVLKLPALTSALLSTVYDTYPGN